MRGPQRKLERARFHFPGCAALGQRNEVAATVSCGTVTQQQFEAAAEHAQGIPTHRSSSAGSPLRLIAITARSSLTMPLPMSSRRTPFSAGTMAEGGGGGREAGQ